MIFGSLGWIIAGCCFWWGRGERETALYWQDMYMQITDGD